MSPATMASATACMTAARGRMSTTAAATATEGGSGSLRTHTGEAVVALDTGTAAILHAAERAVRITGRGK